MAAAHELNNAPTVSAEVFVKNLLRDWSLLQQRGPVEHDADGRSRRSLVLSHLDQESLAVGRGLRGRDHVNVRREGQPLGDATLKGGTAGVHWRGKSCGSSWSRVEDDLSVDAPLWPVAVVLRDLPLALAE